MALGVKVLGGKCPGHILSSLHNLSSATKHAPLTAHFVVPCIHYRQKATKCVAVHGTFCRPREREGERERERETEAVLHSIKRSRDCIKFLSVSSRSRICDSKSGRTHHQFKMGLLRWTSQRQHFSFNLSAIIDQIFTKHQP